MMPTAADAARALADELTALARLRRAERQHFTIDEARRRCVWRAGILQTAIGGIDAVDLRRPIPPDAQPQAIEARLRAWQDARGRWTITEDEISGWAAGGGLIRPDAFQIRPPARTRPHPCGLRALR